MTTASRLHAVALGIALSLGAPSALAAVPEPLAAVRTQADLDAAVAATPDAALKQAIRDHGAAILAAAQQRPHAEAVAKTVEGAKGKVERVNLTPEALKRAAGGDLPVFETLKLVDLAVPNTGPHDRRETDPYDAAFFEHLGHLAALESLHVISTKADDAMIAPIGKLTGLKSLRFVNNGKLTDAGLEQFAGLRQLEQFNFVGTAMTGRAFARFEGWTNLKQSSYRGSSIDDAGLALLCERFPNLQNLSLAHAKFTDAGAPALAKLTKLKGLEVGSAKATPASLAHVAKLPALEYLQIGEGVEGPAGVELIKGVPTLRRLTLTNAKPMTDADLKVVAGMTQLESLELNNLELPDERLGQLKSLAHLKSLRLIRRPQAYGAETQAKVKALLPGVALKFD
ncbi:MAG TPA: hypothetical protein VF796_01905 [Humisphaera sp.]